MKPQILAACPPFALPTLEGVLGSYVELVVAHTFGVAEEILARRKISLVVAGVHFDDARMYHLLKYTRQHYPHLPFVCCRILDAELPAISRQAIAIAAESLGARAYVDYPELVRELGREQAEQDLKAIVLSHVHPHTGSAGRASAASRPRTG